MKTSVSTLRVHSKARKSVDQAESKINRFKQFLQSRKVGKDIPNANKIQRAKNFINKFEPATKGSGLLGNLLKGAGALILLPMLLAKGAMATPMHITSHIMGAYGGDGDAVQKDVQKAEQTKVKTKDQLDKATDKGQMVSKNTIDNVKNIDKDKKAGKQPPEKQPEEVAEDQEALSQEQPSKIEAVSGTSDVGELDVTVKDTNTFGELVARFEKLTKAGSFMEGKPEVVGGTPGEKVKRMGAGMLDALTFNAFDFDKQNKKRKEGNKDQEVTEVPIKITKAEPQEDAMGQKKSGTTGSMDTGSEDFAALTAVSALEGGDSQSRADVAQSIYNRQADGTYGGTVKEVVTADGQYQPAYKDPNVSSGPGTKTSEEFKNITDRKSAVVAMMSYYERRGQDVTKKQMEDLYDKTAADLQNPELQSEAAKHVGGRTEFLGGKVEGSDVVDRGGYQDNAFFAEYGSGKQLERGAVQNPLLTSDASQVQGASIDKRAPEQYPEYEIASAEGGSGGHQFFAMPVTPAPAAPVGGGGDSPPPQFIPVGHDSGVVMAMLQIQGLGAS